MAKIQTKPLRITIGGQTFGQDVVGAIPLCMLLEDPDIIACFNEIAQTERHNDRAVCDFDFLVEFDPNTLLTEYRLDRKYLVPYQVVRDKLNLPHTTHFAVQRNEWPKEEEDKLKARLNDLAALVEKAKPSENVFSHEIWGKNVSREVRAVLQTKHEEKTDVTSSPGKTPRRLAQLRKKMQESGNNPLPVFLEVKKRTAKNQPQYLIAQEMGIEPAVVSNYFGLSQSLHPDLVEFLDPASGEDWIPVAAAKALCLAPQVTQAETYYELRSAGKVITTPQVKRLLEEKGVRLKKKGKKNYYEGQQPIDQELEKNVLFRPKAFLPWLSALAGHFYSIAGLDPEELAAYLGDDVEAGKKKARQECLRIQEQINKLIEHLQ